MPVRPLSAPTTPREDEDGHEPNNRQALKRPSAALNDIPLPTTPGRHRPTRHTAVRCDVLRLATNSGPEPRWLPSVSHPEGYGPWKDPERDDRRRPRPRVAAKARATSTALPPPPVPRRSPRRRLLGFALPPLLASLYREVANGGYGPDYQLLPWSGQDARC